MIDAKILERMILKGLTIDEIASKLNVTQYFVKKALKFYDLKTANYLKNWDLNKLRELSNSCNSKRDLLNKLGMRDSNANYLMLNKIAKNYDIVIPDNAYIFLKKESLTDEEFFVENSNRKGPKIKKRLLKMGVKEECAICSLGTEWNGIKLNHHIDHINGIHTDNTINNLRLLCPNCHSQQETTNRNKTSRKIFYYCMDCNKEISKKSERCKKCSNALTNSKRTKFNPTIEELEKVLKENNCNMSAVGRYYNVSDNAVRKRCKNLDIDFKNKN